MYNPCLHHLVQLLVLLIHQLCRVLTFLCREMIEFLHCSSLHQRYRSHCYNDVLWIRSIGNWSSWLLSILILLCDCSAVCLVLLLLQLLSTLLCLEFALEIMLLIVVFILLIDSIVVVSVRLSIILINN